MAVATLAPQRASRRRHPLMSNVCEEPRQPATLPGPAPGMRRGRSSLDEGEQVLVYLVLPCGAHAVWAALVDLQFHVFDDLGGKHDRGADWQDLIVVAVENQGRHVEFLQVLGCTSPPPVGRPTWIASFTSSLVVNSPRSSA